MMVATGDGGVTAVNGGDGGGVGGVTGGSGGGIIKETVGHDHGVGVGEVKEVVDGERLAGVIIMAIFRRELVSSGGEKATDKALWYFH